MGTEIYNPSRAKDICNRRVDTADEKPHETRWDLAEWFGKECLIFEICILFQHRTEELLLVGPGMEKAFYILLITKGSVTPSLWERPSTGASSAAVVPKIWTTDEGDP